VNYLARQLMFACGLSRRDAARFDLLHELPFEFDVVLSADFSHFEYRAPPPPKENAGRQGLWKMPHRWKSAKHADSHTMLGKASHKTLRLSHFSHSPHYRDLDFPFLIGGL
jgi:hypothetical protein